MGMDDSTFCHICEKPTEATAGDPGKWPMFLPFENGNGQTRCYCMSCVILAVSAVERAKNTILSRPTKGRFAWFGPDEDSPFGNHLCELWAFIKECRVRWKSRGTHATNCMDTAHGVEISCSEVNRTFPNNR